MPPKFPTSVAVAEAELGAAELERCCRGLSAAGRALGAHWGSLERRGTEAPVPRLCPLVPRDAGGGSTVRTLPRFLLPAAGQPLKPCLGGSGESLLAGSVCESRGARFVRLARTREAANDGGFQRQGCRWAPF